MTSVVNQTGGIEIGGTVLYGMDAEHALKQAAKYDYGRERDIVKWIEAVLGEKLPSKDLHESLKSGIILCKLLNKIKPGMIKKYNTRAIALMEIENIKLYLEGCWKLGVPSSCLFISSDLYKARGMNEVLNNLEALSKISARMKTYTGPVMEIHERERSGSSGISSGKKYAPPAKKWATIEMGKPKHINETLNVEDIDIRSENLKLKQALEREICERQYLEKEIEELKAGGGSTSKGSSSSTSSERELQTKIEQLQKTINELERELTETKKRTPSKSTVGKANELPIVKSQLDDEIRAHKLTKQELQNERDKLRKLESELRQVKSGSNKPVSAPVSSSSNKSDAIITNLRDENEMLRLLVSQLRTDLDLAVQYSAPEKQVVGKKHGPNYFIIDEIDESASADVARVESTLEAIFSSSEVEFSEVVELNEFFKNENGRRKFTVMLENVMQGGVVALSDNSFELLLYLINTTLTEMDTSDCNDLITAKILMRASSIVKRESDKQHIQTYISSYSVYHDINFWEELFWDELFRKHKSASDEDDIYTLDHRLTISVLEDLIVVMLHWKSFRDEVIRFIDYILIQTKTPEEHTKLLRKQIQLDSFWNAAAQSEIKKSGTWNPKKPKGGSRIGSRRKKKEANPKMDKRASSFEPSNSRKVETPKKKEIKKEPIKEEPKKKDDRKSIPSTNERKSNMKDRISQWEHKG